MQHTGGRVEVYTGFLWGKLRERDHLEDPGIDGRILLRWIFRKWNVLLLITAPEHKNFLKIEETYWSI
jgi:hypothetical protein